jgi:hypothetical protein
MRRTPIPQDSGYLLSPVKSLLYALLPGPECISFRSAGRYFWVHRIRMLVANFAHSEKRKIERSNATPMGFLGWEWFPELYFVRTGGELIWGQQTRAAPSDQPRNRIAGVPAKERVNDGTTFPESNGVASGLASWRASGARPVGSHAHSELRRMAHRYMARESPGNTLQTTGLVKET